MFTTPPGKSLVAKTSAKVTEHNGLLSLANTIQVFPPAIIGAITETKPNNELSSSASNTLSKHHIELKFSFD